MKGSDQNMSYSGEIITALQWMWGDGYLAPGGPEELAELLQDIPLVGCHVLDIGCGLGAIDVELIKTYEAHRVVGIDVEPHLIELAYERINEAGLAGRVNFKLVEPGVLPFDDKVFDVVFSKDAIVHIENKAAFYREAFRVLKQGGVFVGSDWLCGGKETYTREVEEYLNLINLTYHMRSLKETNQFVFEAGFERVEMRDRNEWYREEVKKELATLSGDHFVQLSDQVGREHAEYRLQVSSIKQRVIEQGFLRPTHIIGYKSAC
jgi:phosphoethanolamine N-methyltransferase